MKVLLILKQLTSVHLSSSELNNQTLKQCGRKLFIYLIYNVKVFSLKMKCNDQFSFYVKKHLLQTKLSLRFGH